MDKIYAEKHKEKTRETKRRYYDKNKEKAIARSIQWDKDNPQKANERHGRWRHKYPEKNALYSHNYKVRKNEAPGRGLTEQDWVKIIEFYGKRCLKCGSTKRITIDHVIPLSVGGWHDPINIQPLCHSCNSGKRHRIADYRPKSTEARAWLISQFGLPSPDTVSMH